METSRSARWYVLGSCCGLLCVGALLWTMWALTRGRLEYGDTAGVVSVVPGVVGMVSGLWGLRVSVRSLHVARTGPAIAADLATAVLKHEGAQYTQLLGGDTEALNGPIDLAFTLTESHGVEGAEDDGCLTDIAKYYLSVRPGRMVITGTPGNSKRRGRGQAADTGPGDVRAGDAGTGKIVLAVALILGLAAGRTETAPVPVRLSAAAWPGTPVRDWLTSHLIGTYHMVPREAQRVVRDNLVFPVIDGLDEMDATPTPGHTSRAAHLLRAVERYERDGKKGPVVLTCRHATYRAIVDARAQPQVVAQVQIARLDPTRIVDYLRGRVGYAPENIVRWQPVLDAVMSATEPSSPLVRMLDTPWRLTLAAVVYQEEHPNGGFLRDPADLVALAEAGELYPHLLDRYIKAAINSTEGEGASPSGHAGGHDSTEPGENGSGPRSTRLDPQATWRHLAVLARYLRANTVEPARRVAGRDLSGTDLVLHELWPLAGPRQALSATAALTRLLLVPLAFTYSLVIMPLLGASLFVTLAVCGAMTFLIARVGRKALNQPWPEPRSVDLGGWRTPTGRRYFASGVVGGAGLGIFKGVQSGVATGVVLGVSAAVAMGTAMAMVLGDKPSPAVSDPRAPLREDLKAHLVVMLGVGTMHGLAGGLVGGLGVGGGIGYGLWCALTGGVGYAVGLAASGGPGAAWLRYVAFLLCVRGALPRGLGGFLHECHRLGLLRTAGTAYQFRHRELQAHLAANPIPPSDI